jgi:hypothetical protein
MSNTNMTVGQVVRYAEPADGEQNERFVVLELRGERVLLGMLGFEGWAIPPTCSRFIAEMTAA